MQKNVFAENKGKDDQMENNVSTLFFKILGCALGSAERQDALFSSIDSETLSKLYALSKSHDLAHVVYDVLAEYPCMQESEISFKFQKQKAIATYRYAGIQCELESVCSLLEKEKISYMPLKGSVIRDYYPNPEMRTSSDIDILIHPEDLERTSLLLQNELQYCFSKRSTHDISLFSPGGVHLELHFSLSENDPKLDTVLLGAWNTAALAEGYSYCFRMSHEMFYVYCLSHMAKHFVGGGCGIRPFMDLWIIERKMGYNKEQAANLLSLCGLTRFSEAAKQLTSVWFENEKYTDLLLETEAYILDGGVFGNMENEVAISTEKKGGRLRYALGRIFVSIDILKLRYPKLEKYPILYPFYWVVRLFRILLGKDRKNAFRELGKTVTMEDAKKQKILTLCKDLELI